MTRAANVWPAIDVRPVSADLILAMVEEFSPTAIEERGDAIRVFFAKSDRRDAAAQAPAERVWSMRKNGKQVDAELRSHGEYGWE